MEHEGGGASRTTDPASGTSTATDVSLREFISMQIAYERRGTFTLVGFLIAIGAFAWSQIQRRLEILNHENARLLQQQANSVSADTYKANEEQRKSESADLSSWRKEVDRDRTQSISRDEFQRDTRTERRASSSYGWQWVLGVTSVLGFVLFLTTFYLAHK